MRTFVKFISVQMILFLTLSLKAESGIYDRFGIINEHGAHGAVPEENIDLFTGNLTLKNLDIHFPGPNGFDLNIWRVYNSKVLKDRFPGGGWGIQQEPYSWVGFGWSMHMGRLHSSNTETPIVEYPDGRWETAYHDINDYSVFVTRDFAKLDKSDWKLYFKDGTIWTFGGLANIDCGNMIIEQVRVVTRITNSYGHHIDIAYDASGSPRMSSITDSMGRIVTFMTDSSTHKLEYIKVRNATGGYVYYSYTVGTFSSGYYKLNEYDPPELNPVTYEYGDGLSSNWELNAVNTSYGGRMEYEYADHTFYYFTYALSTKVVQTKRIKFSSSSDFRIWGYTYPSYYNVDCGTVEIDGPTFNSTVEYYAYDSSAPWRIGLLKKKAADDGSFTEQYEWSNKTISTTRWHVLNTDMGQAAAPLIKMKRNYLLGNADITEEFLYERSDTTRYGLPTKIRVYSNDTLKNYREFSYYFESSSLFEAEYMLEYLKNETIKSSSGTKMRETEYAYYSNGAIDSIKKWKGGTTYLTWNYGYSGTNPNSITITIDLPGSGGTETWIYKYGVLATLNRPIFTEMSREISSYNSAILSETNQNGGKMDFIYDDIGRIVKIEMPSGFNDVTASWYSTYVIITQGSHKVYKYWDGMGRNTGHAETGDGIVLYYRKTLDSEGRLIGESKGSTDIDVDYNYVLSAAGAIKKITDPRGKITNIALATDKKTITDPNGNDTNLEYNHLPGLITKLTDAAGKIAMYSYDAIGRLINTTFNSSRTQTYTYNGLDQVTSESHPETGSIEYSYDTENNLATKTWGTSTFSYTYNSSNQMLTENAGDENLSFSYDSRGRISGVTSNLGWAKSPIVYNSLGAITGETISIPGLSAKIISYSYDGNNQLNQITYPDGKNVNYTNNGLNLPETVAFNGSTIVSTASYGINKQPAAITISANGTSYSATYNNLGGILSAKLNKGSSSLYNASYAYDGVGNITALNNAIPSLNTAFSYDNRNRLTGASYTPSGVGRVNDFAYTYDYYGNLTQVKENGIVAYSASCSTKNQISGFSYDSRGNLTSSTLYNYGWDHRNRLELITKKMSGESKGAFLYDEKGMRIKAIRPIAPCITVLAPNGGENWVLGSAQNIIWSSMNVTAKITIELLQNDAVIGVIAENILIDAGSYAWTVGRHSGGMAAAGTGYCIQIRTVDGSCIDKSDAMFTIQPSNLTIVSPNGEENYLMASKQNIVWSTSGTVGNVRLVLFKGSAKVGDIVVGLPPDQGNYSWKVGSYSGGMVPVGTDYRIKVADIYGNSDYSDNNFSITAPPGLMITSPNGGESWALGEQKAISWTANGINTNVRLVLFEGGNKVGQIVTGLPPDQGSYLWTVGNHEEGTVIPGSNYFIKVADNSENSDLGDAPFSILTSEGLRITSPCGGENWEAGSIQNITWKGGREIRELSIEYSTDLGSTYHLINGHALNTGAYAWQTPHISSRHCLIRISDAEGQSAIENSILNCELVFNLKGENLNKSEPLISFGFVQTGGYKILAKSKFPMLTLSHSELSDGYNLDFGDNRHEVPKNMSPFEKNRQIRILWDWMNGRGTVYYGHELIMVNVPLLPVFDPAFNPSLFLRAGNGADALQVDDCKVSLVFKNRSTSSCGSSAVSDLVKCDDKHGISYQLVFDEFESYQADEPLLRGGWTTSIIKKKAKSQNDGCVSGQDELTVGMAIDTQAPIFGMQSGKAFILSNSVLAISKLISWPKQMPLAVSTRPFSIVPLASQFNERRKGAPRYHDDFNRDALDEQNMHGPHAFLLAKTTPLNASLYTSTYYIYSYDGKLISEYDSNGTCLKDYIHMGRRLLAEYLPLTGNKYYYTFDQINSTRIITDNTGSVIYSTVFDPYGGIQKEWVNTYHPSLKFSGKEREQYSELDYFGARYYDYAKFSFISPDPMLNKARLISFHAESNEMGKRRSCSSQNSEIMRFIDKNLEDAILHPHLWNLYAFNRNNPVTYFDPDGRSSLTFDRSDQKLSLFNNSGTLIGTYDASNNAQSGTSQFPAGSFDYHHFTLHPNAQASDAISASGFYGFDVNGNTKYGIHAGREGQTDLAGRTGWKYATNGCIRTTEAAMTAISSCFQSNDPLTSITVQE